MYFAVSNRRRQSPNGQREATPKEIWRASGRAGRNTQRATTETTRSQDYRRIVNRNIRKIKVFHNNLYIVGYKLVHSSIYGHSEQYIQNCIKTIFSMTRIFKDRKTEMSISTNTLKCN